MKRLRIIVSGVVQGVGYRFFARNLAVRHGIDGFVRNLPDGTVEVEAQGEDGVLGAFVKELKIGPRSGHVSALEIEEIPEGEATDGFDISL